MTNYPPGITGTEPEIIGVEDEPIVAELQNATDDYNCDIESIYIAEDKVVVEYTLTAEFDRHSAVSGMRQALMAVSHRHLIPPMLRLLAYYLGDIEWMFDHMTESERQCVTAEELSQILVLAQEYGVRVRPDSVMDNIIALNVPGSWPKNVTEAIARDITKHTYKGSVVSCMTTNAVGEHTIAVYPQKLWEELREQDLIADHLVPASWQNALEFFSALAPEDPDSYAAGFLADQGDVLENAVRRALDDELDENLPIPYMPVSIDAKTEWDLPIPYELNDKNKSR